MFKLGDSFVAAVLEGGVAAKGNARRRIIFVKVLKIVDVGEHGFGVFGGETRNARKIADVRIIGRMSSLIGFFVGSDRVLGGGRGVAGVESTNIFE